MKFVIILGYQAFVPTGLDLNNPEMRILKIILKEMKDDFDMDK